MVNRLQTYFSTGKAFVLMSVLYDVGIIAQLILFNTIIYPATNETFPGFSFIVAAAIGVTTMLLWYVP